ncbi:MAG: glycosyltransferase family 4 protein [Coriobacteriia bacterium]|nr:glycosyltransferase family 4 protein [Coriobacteriia bacterium]
MHILYLHQFFATRDSSHPTRSYEFARRMVSAGHEVTMLTGNSRLGALHDDGLVRHFVVDGISVRSVRNRYSNAMGHARRIVSFAVFAVTSTIEAARVRRPDIVFATSTPLTIGVPGWIAAKVRRVPFVFEVRDPWPEAAFQMGALQRGSALGRLALWLERFLYREADAIVGLSPGMIECILAAGADPGKTHMIPNCSDLDLFHPGPKDPGTVERYGLRDLFVVGYTGAVGPTNAVHVIADAAAILKERGRDDIAVLVAGDGKCLAGIRTDAQARGLDNLRLIGPLPKTVMPDLLRTCDVLLGHLAKVPVLYTGSPNKLFDALASGRPVIVNSPGWTRPLVEESGAGLFVDPEDAVALVDAIIGIADDPQRADRMGKAARAVAERDFSRDEQADRLIALLQSVRDARTSQGD